MSLHILLKLTEISVVESELEIHLTVCIIIPYIKIKLDLFTFDCITNTIYACPGNQF